MTTIAMPIEVALQEPLVRRVLARVLDRLDVQPAAERTLGIRIDLDANTAPEIHSAESLADREVAWAALDGLVASDWAKCGYRLHRRHGAREERQPFLDFRCPPEVEERIRRELGRPGKGTSYAAIWRGLVAKADLDVTEERRMRIASSPLMVSGRSADEVLSHLLGIRNLANEPLLLREVSSRVFWGLSKLLDGRGDIVAALLGLDECPFPEQPIVLNVHVGIGFSSFLFVENHVSFERLKRRTDLGEHALVYCSGFRGAAARLRQSGGCSVYYTRASTPDAAMAFEQTLFSKTEIPVFFWGDLDFSGMAILASLRSIFPTAEAWKPGYAPMLKRLLEGDGHSPAEAGKEKQRPVARSGSAYADEVLIPAIEATHCFVDQE